MDDCFRFFSFLFSWNIIDFFILLDQIFFIMFLYFLLNVYVYLNLNGYLFLIVVKLLVVSIIGVWSEIKKFRCLVFVFEKILF